MKYPEDYINKVICGDCFKAMEGIPDKSVNYIFTDPPWNVKKDYGIYKDKLSKNDYRKLITNLKDEWSRISNLKYTIVLGSEIFRDWWDIFVESKIIIVKLGAIVLTRKNNFHLQWKPLLTNCDSNRFMTDFWDDIRWPGEGYFFNEKRYGHPAMTPLKLMKRIISIFTNPDDIILDPYNGVGTTTVACKELGRKYIGIEINPKYCGIARRRLSGVTPPLF